MNECRNIKIAKPHKYLLRKFPQVHVTLRGPAPFISLCDPMCGGGELEKWQNTAFRF